MKPRFSKDSDSSGISLRDLIAPLFRRKRLFFAVSSVVFVGIAAYFLLMPSYKSQMDILVNRERMDPLVTMQATSQLVTEVTPLTDEEINSEAELIKSADVLEKVVVANGLDQPHEHSLRNLFLPKPSQPERLARAVKSLAGSIKVQAITKTNLVQVSYASSNPQLAYGVLHSLGGFYLQKHEDVHRPTGSYEFFAQETQHYLDQLNSSEERLKKFSQQSGMGAPDIERTNMAGQAAIAVGNLHAAQQALASDEQRIASDRAQLANTPERSRTQVASNVADKLVGDLTTTLLSAQTKRSQLLLKYDPSYPLVREIDQEIAQAEAAINKANSGRYVNETTDRDPTYELLREDIARTQSDQAAQRAAIASIESGIANMRARIADLSQQTISQQDLQRDQKANENNYLLYLQKREQERMRDALDNTRIANVAIAVPPAIPALPSLGRFLGLAIALGMGLLAGLVVAYLADYLDSTFHGPDQVRDVLGIPVVVAMSKRTA